MTALPTWADNAEARRLLASITANPPETRLIRDDWGTRDMPCYRTWKRPDVAALKRLHRDWLDRELEALDTQCAVSGRWDNEAANAVLGAETPDQVIHRLLSQPEQQQQRAA